MKASYKEKIILITGVGGGIGRSLARYFAPKVKHLVTASRSTDDELHFLDGLPPNHTHFSIDLTVESNVSDLFTHIADEIGKIDVLINTVGGSLFSHTIEEFPLNQFNRVISVNLTSAFLLTKYAVKQMRLNGSRGGNIIHMVSSSAKKFSNNKAPYGVAKAGLARLIQYAAMENGPYGIKINGISPTYVFTKRHEQSVQTKMKKSGKTRQQIVESKINGQLLKKEMIPDDLIPVTDLLTSTNVITGQIINCSLGEVINY